MGLLRIHDNLWDEQIGFNKVGNGEGGVALKYAQGPLKILRLFFHDCKHMSSFGVELGILAPSFL